jgi:hypothetical protein
LQNTRICRKKKGKERTPCLQQNTILRGIAPIEGTKLFRFDEQARKNPPSY